MDTKSPMVVLRQDGGAPATPSPAAPPAFFVILKPGQPGDKNKEQQGILVSNQDLSAAAAAAVPKLPPSLIAIAPAPAITPAPVPKPLPVLKPLKAPPALVTTIKPKSSEGNLPAECVHKSGVRVTLDNNNMWNEFYRCHTEMILTKQGRRMFPYCRFRLSGLEPFLRYILVMDITPVDSSRYKWNGRHWEANGKAEPHVLGRVFIHPESPSSGHYWMQQPVSFYKLKLTNNTLDQEGHVILHSMHRYLPRLHVVPADKATEVIQLNGPEVMTFSFTQNEFFAVTAYQNLRITQLKIDYNPFAKGFREDGQCYRPARAKVEGLDSKPLSLGEEGRAGGKPMQTSLKALFGHAESFDEVMDQELFSNEGFDINILHRQITPAKLSTAASASVIKTEKNEAPSALNWKTTPSVAPAVQLKEEEGLLAVKTELPSDDELSAAGEHVGRVIVKEEEEEEEEEEEKEDTDPIKPHPDSPLGVAKAKLLKLKPCSNKTALQEKDKPLPAGSDCPPNIPSDSPEKESQTTPAARRLHRPSPQNMLHKLSLSLQRARSKQRPIAPRPPPDPAPEFAVLSGLPMSSKAAAAPSPLPSVKKRRQRKVRFGKTGKASRKAATALGPADTSMQPDLEDVEGVLFVSFARKDVLDLHLGDQPQRGEPQLPPETTLPPERKEAPECVLEQISRLERKLLDDLRRLRHRQVIHPVLQEVGMKLNSVDRRMDIDLKYLGVSLPLPPPVTCPGGEGGSASQNTSPDVVVPFVSRTGKTNDFTKIKGWREKFSVKSEAAPSKPEGGAVPSESALKNRSAFCSDALDEYLEAEAKLIDQRAASFSPSAACAPVAYQLPTKSTSYVRTLDSVLKKQAPPYTAPRPSPASKPTPTTPRKHKQAPKNKTPRTAGKAKPGKPALPVPRPVHPAARHKPSPKPAAKSKPLPLSSLLITPPPPPPPPLPPSLGEVYQLGALPDSVPLKQDGLGRGPGSSNSRAQGLSKNMLKLMDLEDGALWEGRPRTFITEERAEVALSSLLTAQGSLKGKPLGKLVTRRAPPCLNDFCRLGCVCSSLFQERRLPTHCCKPGCMFGCTCLKRKVLLVKAAEPKRKKQRKAEERADLIFYSALGEGEGGEEPVCSKHKKKRRRRRRRRRIEYTISEPEAESQPAAPRVLKLWTPVAGEIDPEPVFIPTPSACVPPHSPPRSPHSGKGSGKGYTCRPSSAIQDEDKGPVYLYFESMMTCARVRGFDRAHKENTPCGLKIEREEDPNHMFLSARQGKSVKECRQQQGGGGSSEEPIKLIEIVAECDWEHSRSKILNALSRRVNQGDLAQPFGAEGFLVELESQSERREGGKLVIASRVRISQPGPREEEEEEEEEEEREWGRVSREKEVFMMSSSEGLETVSRKKAGVKGLPFYTGVSPAGLLNANKKHSDSSTQDLVKVNGKSYPQAKLLLGQMGALHPANRLAAYITGRLRPTSLELSHVTSILSKKARGGKEPQLASKEADKRASRGGQAPSPVTPSRAEASAAPSLSTAAPSISTGSALTFSKLGMATLVTKPSVGNVFTQFVVNKTGSLQQSPPGLSPPHPQTVPSVVMRPALPARGSDQGAEVPPAMSSSSTPSSSDEGPRLASPPAAVAPVAPGIALPDRRPGTRLLLIPMPSAPPVRPPQTPLGPQFPPGQRMVLQPIRTPSGANLFRHPNGQIIQLVPLNQLRASLQPNMQHVVLRNQGSVIRLPAPPQPAAATDPSTASVMSPVRSSSVASPATGPTGITTSPTQKPVPAPSFVSQPGTLTFRISPPVGAGVTLTSANLLPAQTGSFALLQVPKPASTSAPVPTPLLTPATPKTPSSVPQATTETEKPGNNNPDNRLTSEVGEGEGQGESGVTEEEEEEEASGGNQEDADDKEEDDQGQKPKLTSSPSPTPAQEQPGSPDSESETSFQAAAVSSDHSYTNGLEQRRESKGQSSESDRSCLAERIGGSAELEDPSPLPLAPSAASPPTPTPKPLRTLMDLKSSPVLILGGSSKSLVPSVAAAKPPVELGLDSGSGSRGGLDLGSGGGGGVGGSGPGRPNESRADPSREALNLGLEDGEVQEEEEEEEEEDDKTDNSEDEFEGQDSEEDSEGDEMQVMDSEASDSSEEEEDDEEAIDIETVEELSEKISIARLKASAMQTRLVKECSLFQPKIVTKHSVKRGRRVEEEEEELVEVETCSRLNHTANERRRRSEMRELFDKMKKVLGLHRLPKASKYYILKQAHNEIQALEDQADRLQGQKNLLSRRRAVLVKKIAQTSGKTEELILKKLEYISAKQKAVEMQRKKLGKSVAAGVTPREPPRPLAHVEPSEPPLKLDSSHAGRPLILSRKRAPHSKTAGVLGSSSVLSTGSLVVTPEGRLVSLKPPLQTGPPMVAAEITSLPGVASVMIQLPGLTLPIQVKNCIPLPVTGAQTSSQRGALRGAQTSSQRGALRGAQGGAQTSSQRGALRGAQGGAQTSSQRGALSGAQGGAQTSSQRGALSGAQGGAQTSSQRGALSGSQGRAQSGVQGRAQTSSQRGAQSGAQSGAQGRAQGGAQSGVQGRAQSGAQSGSSLPKTGTAEPEEFIMPRIVNVTSLAVSDTEKQGAPPRPLDSSLEGQPGPQEEPAGGKEREALSSSGTPVPEGPAEQSSGPLDQSRSCLEEERERGKGAAREEPASPGRTAEGEEETRERDQKDGGDPAGDPDSSQEEAEDEDEDPEDDRLTSLLNEIVFLNQQRGSDMQTQFTQCRETKDNGSAGGVANTVSPLFLQLADELLDPPCAESIDSDRQQGAPGEGDFVRIVLGSEFVDSGSGASSSTGVMNGTSQQGRALTPPPLLQHMRLGSSTCPSSPPTSTQHTPADNEAWRPMPKLAPLGLKSGLNQTPPSPPHSTSTLYTTTMPLLAPASPREGKSSRSPPLLSQADC
ncbi:MAX gene-associated protein-like isoform X2 [Polyodon spathula]|uniref:MAX gene-associated protein-like isoform X2 n=1 Tax=Polyodon spathula TaxID=7913 RepID=UPI001B7F3572|nr:MAX gene-associated protein-like isoform X2 [Polyodon spathula]